MQEVKGTRWEWLGEPKIETYWHQQEHLLLAEPRGRLKIWLSDREAKRLKYWVGYGGALENWPEWKEYLEAALQPRKAKVQALFGNGVRTCTLGSWPWRLGRLRLKLKEVGWHGKVWVMTIRPSVEVGGQERRGYVCKY